MKYRFLCDHADFDVECLACLQRENRHLRLMFAALLSMCEDEIRIPKRLLVEAPNAVLERVDDAHSDDIIFRLQQD